MAGDDAAVVEPHMLHGDQRGGDEQGLGHRSVTDLVGVGGGAEADEIDPGQRRPPAESGFRAGEVEPGGEEAGFLGALAWGENCEHAYDCPG